jgi:hypothetical protein
MPNLMPEITAVLFIAVVVLWASFAFFVGPTLWKTDRHAFAFDLTVAGIAYGWFAARLLPLDRTWTSRMSQSAFETWGPTAIDVVAVLAAAGIAVWGSIRGAREGAKQGAEATRAVTQALAQESEKRQRASVRLLLRLEIDHNLASLRDLRSELYTAAIRTPRGEAGDPENPTVTWDYYARALVIVAMPAWTRQAWESMTALLSPALDPKEIEQANIFYGHLETISVIRDQLTVMASEKPHMEDWGIGRGARSVRPTTFFEHSPGLARDFDNIVVALLATGNPISEA